MVRRSRRLTWLTVAALLLGGVYTAYWFWLAQRFENNLALWIDQQRANGYQISYVASQPYGYPLSVKINARDIKIDSPPHQSPWQLTTPWKLLSIAPWSPLSLQIADHPDDSAPGLLLNTNGREFYASTADLRITLGLSASGNPPSIEIAAQSIGLDENEYRIVGATKPSLRLDLFETSSHEERTAEFQFNANSLDFPSQLETGPRTIKTNDWSIAAQVKGPIPLAPLPAALAAWSSNGGIVELRQFAANWNEATEISGNGTLALDGNLQPLFAGTAMVRGYSEAIDALVQAGLMQQNQATGAKIALAAMAKPADDGGPPTAKLPLTIQDGFLFVGPLKLARMPRIVWQ